MKSLDTSLIQYFFFLCVAYKLCLAEAVAILQSIFNIGGITICLDV